MGRMFEKRKHTMFARWDRMAKAFTRCGKDIAIAVRAGGENPDYNPALRRAIQNARSVNMPKDKIANAIKKAMGADAADYAIVNYEGYAPHGIAVLVETATDNPTRTVATVRFAFKKHGGNMGNSGSVAFMFDQMGAFKLKTEGLDLEELELDLIDHGLEDLEQDESEEHGAIAILRCAFTDFNNLQTALDERDIKTISAETEWVPKNLVELPEAQGDEVLKLIDAMEQDEDVQNVFHNLA
ncbi:MAG: YebC/PmpR family DNA-binding transcriptional regulator [Proteobacteria bacterium]|nr:YebC/PmpR family DNA-binding transcriptional regulator [Pseudomonadota bacterium]MCP4918063.1 YebC/PmpR family DNA-binding transcriptional regulator [Pseudomonadota bacterium]